MLEVQPQNDYACVLYTDGAKKMYAQFKKSSRCTWILEDTIQPGTVIQYSHLSFILVISTENDSCEGEMQNPVKRAQHQL